MRMLSFLWFLIQELIKTSLIFIKISFLKNFMPKSNLYNEELNKANFWLWE
jgi:hypothetical protein